MVLSRSRERAWIEIVNLLPSMVGLLGRSREGAWIEIMSMTPTGIFTNAVAPVRERGLK